MLLSIKQNSYMKEQGYDPKKYAEGKIYAIKCHQTGRQYIGSTIETLDEIMIKHLRNYRCWTHGKTRFCELYSIIHLDDYEVVVLEHYPCASRWQLGRREGWYQLNMKCVNKFITGRTYHEYKEANKDKIQEYHKKYREANKDKLQQRFNCPCGGRYTFENKTRHEKTQKHKDFISKN